MADHSKLEDAIKSDHDFFVSMLDSIPPTFYFDDDTKKFMRDEVEEDSDEEFQRLVHKPGKSKKRSASDDAALKAERKRAKFDPTQIKTVSQMTEQIAVKEQAMKAHKHKHKKGGKEPIVNGPATIRAATTSSYVLPSATPTSPTDLRHQLKARIDLLRAKRKALGREEEMEKKRLKRQVSKTKLKIKRHNLKHEKGQLPNGHGLGSPKPKTPVPAKPVFNKEGKMVFSKFDFSEKKDKKPEKKNYKKLLEKVQHSKEKLTQLEQTDSDAAKSLKQKQQWKSVLQKAEGVRVKDNPDMIKKSMKKRDKRKERSRKDWQGRQDKVDQKMKQRQDKRQQNIKKKKDGRINKKISKQKKKGRIIPGF